MPLTTQDGGPAAAELRDDDAARPVLFSGTLTRFVALTAALLGVILAVGAPFMVRTIRADGGTSTEYVFFGLYAVVLIAGFASATLLGGAAARRLGGPRAEQVLALALATAAGLGLLVDEVTFALLGLHPYGKLTWAAVAAEDIRQLPLWTPWPPWESSPARSSGRPRSGRWPVGRGVAPCGSAWRAGCRPASCSTSRWGC